MIIGDRRQSGVGTLVQRLAIRAEEESGRLEKKKMIQEKEKP